MGNETNKQFQRNDVFSKRIRAGKRRTYFFDVRTTKGNDYYLTITESKKRFHDDGYERHKIFVYKEDFNKFVHTLEDIVNHIKENLMPDYDFDMYTREPEDITNLEEEQSNGSPSNEESNAIVEAAEKPAAASGASGLADEQENGDFEDSDNETTSVDEVQEGTEEEVISWD